MSSEILTLKYDIDKPIPLEEFVASLRSLNSLHSTEGVQLCVKEIRKGSYIFELINQVPDVFNEVMPILVNTSESLGTFAKHVSSILDFFKSGKKPSEDKKITKQEAQAAHDLVAPLTLENKSTLSFENAHVEGDVQIVYNYTEAHAIQNASRKYIEELDRTTRDIKEKVSLQWKNLSDQDNAGNKSVIPDISDRTVVTRFGSEMLHDKMVKQSAHPFKHLWEVNVHVEWHGEIPKRYTILEIIEDLGEV